jgi:2-isopropylmalate synthase
MDGRRMKEKIIIFDTTLRDGEQSPGASLNNKEKLEIAKQLEALGVDIIEAGFPISSPGDFQSVKTVAKEIKKAGVCGLARAIKSDIDSAYNAVKHARRPRIHVFLATSEIHMKYKLKKAESEILKASVAAVKYARRKLKDIEFSPEDASRTNRQFLHKVVEAVIDAGATTVNIPDTVGYSTPYEFGSLIKGIKDNVPNIHKAVISVHCHNDLGLGVSNSLAAVLNGAGQVECTINGLGERAGNASLEEIVMSLATRGDIFKVGTSIKTKEIHKTSRLVSKLTGIRVQPNKAIVGANAFAHEAGIHQDGLLKERRTYEIMKPQDVGFEETKLVLGKHSGRHALKARLKKLGYTLTDKEIGKAFVRFKKLADKKKEIFDEDLATIVEDEISAIPEIYRLVSFYISSGNKVAPSATIVLKHKGRDLTSDSTGDGPVDACYKAVEKIARTKPKLLGYNLNAVTAGKDALGEVSVRMKIGKNIVSGRGASTDIIEASLKAYLNALNKAAAR